MHLKHLTMRASLSITIVVMGFLGLALALMTGEVYRQQTLDNQRSAMANMLRLKTDDLLKDLEVKSRDLGMAIQHNPDFQRAFAARDTRSLVQLMDNQFHQYFETANVIKLEKLRVFGIDYKLFAESSEGDPRLTGEKNACPALIQKARTRQGPARIKAISDLCP
ncbi:MAG: hypothetical protein OEY27_08885, partial [Gammaproteobacteria bacterium]|nr:hypothetical protein [Gammaproteobacteria bacterium]